MSDSFDREKVVDCMFDPVTSAILAELESGEKECAFLADVSSITESEVQERLDYLVKTGFIYERVNEEKTFFSANEEKLTNIIEHGENFDAAVSGLEKMDSFLN